MNILKNKKTAIIGGGPGGLTLARLLQINGADVTVYERDAHRDARMQGATLDLHYESGLKALRAAGLMEAFMNNYRPGADRLSITDKYGNIIMEDDTDKQTGLSRPEIDRGPLQNILLDSLQEGTVIWDSHFVKMEPQATGWQLEFKNGRTVYADLVIAADGASSKVRPYLTPIKPFYAGITVIEGFVYHSATASPKIHRLLNGGKIFALGNEQSLIVSSKGDGSLVFYTGCKTTETWGRESGIDFNDKVQVLDWFKKDFAGWGELWLELFENAEPHFNVRPQYCMPLDQHWEPLPNLTLLGDAAHLMPPYAGEGVNMAMLDALELSHCLTGSELTNMQAAIKTYEINMRARASQTAAITLQSTSALHSPEAIPFLLEVIS